MNTEIKMYDFLGNLNSDLTIVEPTEFTLRFVSLKQIVISDASNLYQLYMTKQPIQCANEKEFAELFLQQKMDIVNLASARLAQDDTVNAHLPLGVSGNLQTDAQASITGDTIGLAKDATVGTLFKSGENI